MNMCSGNGGVPLSIHRIWKSKEAKVCEEVKSRRLTRGTPSALVSIVS